MHADQQVESVQVGDRPESLILALLCAGRVEDAAEVAERAHMFRLAMLLCQAGSDDQVMFRVQDQVELWEDHEATDLLPEDLLAVYKILGTIRCDTHYRANLSACHLSMCLLCVLMLNLYCLVIIIIIIRRKI
jgi:hypothetical protein